MKEKEIEILKIDLMKPAYTEELHRTLKELNPNDSRKIVESMTDNEIFTKVNNRLFQDSYIADYIDYLWYISKPAFWKHVIISLNVNKGILWGEDMQYFRKICNNKIPNDVLNAVLNFAVNCKSSPIQDLDAIGCVIKGQADIFGRIAEINKYISMLSEDVRDLAKNRIYEMIKCECKYTFY